VAIVIITNTVCAIGNEDVDLNLRFASPDSYPFCERLSTMPPKCDVFCSKCDVREWGTIAGHVPLAHIVPLVHTTHWSEAERLLHAEVTEILEKPH
jgi:hypothetical protein